MEANAAELVERANCARMASARAPGEEPEGDEPVPISGARGVGGRVPRAGGGGLLIVGCIGALGGGQEAESSHGQAGRLAADF